MNLEVIRINAELAPIRRVTTSDLVILISAYAARAAEIERERPGSSLGRDPLVEAARAELDRRLPVES